jgi:adenine-specific DNA-methyltransferase
MQQLEGSISLNWVNKKGALIYENDRPEWVHEKDIRVSEKRPLLFDLEMSTKEDAAHKIFQGDNLLIMNSLLPYYRGAVKQIYIDPPYNTKNTFFHYDDNLQHSEWLTFMRDRLKLAKEFLDPEQGSIWIQIDDDEHAYLKIMCDEIFDRKNFVASIVWQKKYSPQNDARYFSDMHDYILVYARNKELWKRNLMPRTEKQNKIYKNLDNDPRGLWRPDNLSVKTPNPRDIYPITTPSGRVVNPPEGRSWVVSKERYEDLVKDKRIWFGEKGNNVPALKRFLSEVKQGVVPVTWWSYEETGHNEEGKKEIKKLFPKHNDPFGTPKPERLLERILTIGSNEGDLIMDFFAGSGTSGIVAHKMKRKSIMIEKGEHAETIIVPRFSKLFNGESIYEGNATPGDVSFYRLGESILLEDRNWNEELDANTIAEYALLNLDFKLIEINQTRNATYYLGRHIKQREAFAVFAYEARNSFWTEEKTEEVKAFIPAGSRLTVFTNCAVLDLATDRIDFKPIPAAIVRLFAEKTAYRQEVMVGE